MKNKLAMWAAKWFLGGVFRDIAEGKRWPKLTKAYWAVASQKTKIGAAIGLLFGAAAAFAPEVFAQYSATAAVVIGMFVAYGLIDNQWWTISPPEEWGRAFAAIMSFGPVLSALVALSVEWIPKIPNCANCTSWVGKIQVAAAAVAAVTAWLSARFTRPPAYPVAIVGPVDPVKIVGVTPNAQEAR